MIIDTPIWRNADLIRIIPITRADLNQAISRNDFRPEDTPKPGKARWYSGTRSVSYDGKSVTYGSDAELAAAASDIERRIAALEKPGRRILRPYAVKDL